MLAVIVYSCLATDPTRCDQDVIAWVPETTIPECAALSQPHIEAWAKDNPDLVMQSTWCMHSRVTPIKH